MTDNAIFFDKICKIFWHLKVTQPFMCFRENQVCMLLTQSNIFISSPRWIFISSPVGFVVSPVGFLISLGENLLLGLTPEKFWTFGIFPLSQAVPTGVMRQGVKEETSKKVCLEIEDWKTSEHLNLQLSSCHFSKEKSFFLKVWIKLH